MVISVVPGRAVPFSWGEPVARLLWPLVTQGNSATAHVSDSPCPEQEFVQDCTKSTAAGCQAATCCSVQLWCKASVGTDEELPQSACGAGRHVVKSSHVCAVCR